MKITSERFPIADVTVGGNTYTIDNIQIISATVDLGGNAASDWVLHVGERTSFALSAATTFETRARHTMTTSLSWSGGDVISVWIAVAAAQSTDATLSALSLVNAADDAAITLTPTVSGTETYTADVASGVAQVTVTATANHGSATFVITPTDANSGTAGHQVNLGTPGSDTGSPWR